MSLQFVSEVDRECHIGQMKQMKIIRNKMTLTRID